MGASVSSHHGWKDAVRLVIMYRGYDIVLLGQIRNNLLGVFWYPFNGQGAIEKRGGFLSEEDAIGYAKHRVDERLAQLEQLRRLEHVSNVSDQQGNANQV